MSASDTDQDGGDGEAVLKRVHSRYILKIGTIGFAGGGALL